MSSFRKNISDKINHGLAGFKVATLATVGTDRLGPDALWLLEHVRGHIPEGERYARRTALNPAAMKKVLPDVLILEPQFAESGKILDVRVRVIGTGASWFYGEAGGQTVRAFDDDMAAQRALDMATQCMASGEAVVGTSFRINHDVAYYDVTVLMLPLAEDGMHISHFIAHASVGTRTA